MLAPRIRLRPGSIASYQHARELFTRTSQVQRNIIGERILGLPKEPRADEGPGTKPCADMLLGLGGGACSGRSTSLALC